jgi:acetyl esterase/lipase
MIQSSTTRRWLYTSLLVLLFALASCSGNSAASKPTVTKTVVTTALPSNGQYQITTQISVSYGPLPEETLDLCIPKNPSQLRPGVIMIHGGGWIEGTSQQYAPFCQELASLGFVAASINYRLAPTHTWPDQLVDSQLAVRWLRAHASDFHLDSQHLCAWGDSAGAHLAVFLGSDNTIHSGDQASVLADQSPKVQCVVDAYGPVDLVNGTATTLQMDLLLALFGGVRPEQNATIYHDASPIFLISSQSAPTLIIQGTQDTLVPPQQSQELKQKLQASDIAVQYIDYPGNHAFAGLTDDAKKAIYGQIIQYLVAQMKP